MRRGCASTAPITSRCCRAPCTWTPAVSGSGHRSPSPRPRVRCDTSARSSRSRCRQTPPASACARAAWRCGATMRSRTRSRRAMRSKSAAAKNVGNTACRHSARRGNGPRRSRPHSTIEERPLAEFLAWMAREHGWQLHFGDEQQQTPRAGNPPARFAGGTRRPSDAGARGAGHRRAAHARRRRALGGPAMKWRHAWQRCASRCCSPRLPWPAMPRTRFRRAMRAGDRVEAVLAALNAQGLSHRVQQRAGAAGDDAARGADLERHRQLAARDPVAVESARGTRRQWRLADRRREGGRGASPVAAGRDQPRPST